MFSGQSFDCAAHRHSRKRGRPLKIIFGKVFNKAEIQPPAVAEKAPSPCSPPAGLAVGGNEKFLRFFFAKLFTVGICRKGGRLYDYFNGISKAFFDFSLIELFRFSSLRKFFRRRLPQSGSILPISPISRVVPICPKRQSAGRKIRILLG